MGLQKHKTNCVLKFKSHYFYRMNTFSNIPVTLFFLLITLLPVHIVGQENQVDNPTTQELAEGQPQNDNTQSSQANIEKSLDEHNQSIIRLQKNLIYFTVVLLLLISIFAILVYKGFRTNKKLVSELRLSNKMIEEKNQSLEKLVAVKDKIFSIISHDLKTPIVSLNNSLEVMKNEAVKKELKKKALESSKQQLDNTIHLLNNLLDWAKNQMDVIKSQNEMVNICDSIHQNLKLIEQAAKEKEISLSVKCDKGLAVIADNELINLVLRNLLTNAVKFTPRNGQIKVAATSINGSIKISVTDSGIGISIPDQEKILSTDKFLKKYGTDFETGSGIGLKLCLDYIKYMNGELTIESEPEKGSTFSFTIPSGNKA